MLAKRASRTVQAIVRGAMLVTIVGLASAKPTLGAPPDKPPAHSVKGLQEKNGGEKRGRSSFLVRGNLGREIVEPWTGRRKRSAPRRSAARSAG